MGDFYFLDREVLHWSKKNYLEILMDLHVLRLTESKKSFLACHLSVCLSVDTITQKIIELAQPNLVCDLYSIKLSGGIVYEQNQPTGVAPALIAHFVFLAKRALKMRFTKMFSRQKLLQITIHNFWCKKFFNRPTGLASALIAQFVFLVKVP